MLNKYTLWGLLSSFTWLLLAANAPLANATEANDETWYQIEVVIAQRTKVTQLEEQFPFQPAPITWPRGRKLSDFNKKEDDHSQLDNVEFIRLPADQNKLNTEARNLAKQGDYKVLVHQSWRQILRPNKAINWVDIKGGYAWAGHQQLEGSLGFSKGRYLHIHSNLYLNQFPSIASNSSQRAKQQLLSAGRSLVPIVETRYSLIQRRKMRSKELHYLDHPKLVLLVKIIPFTPAQPIIEAEPIPELKPAPALVDLTVPTPAE